MELEIKVSAAVAAGVPDPAAPIAFAAPIAPVATISSAPTPNPTTEEKKDVDSKQGETVDATAESKESKESKQAEPLSNEEAPRSLVAGKGHHETDLLQSKCFNRFYDGLTIFISIADVTTDIMVLLSYYENNRMTLFYISLVILLLAQFGYVMVFIFTFEIEDFLNKLQETLICICCDFYCCIKGGDTCSTKCPGCIKCCNRCCDKMDNKCCTGVLIFMTVIIVGTMATTILAISMSLGHLVAFLMYFAEDKDSRVCKMLRQYCGIVKRSRIPLEDHLSDQTKFAIDKINKHGGFILEAFMEALPQSILQLTAMVYYKETNIISIGSILLSMTSIMTKSFVISQGVEWKSYLFCWLCVITDFFSIFFIVSWIFLSNDYINGNFLNYFSFVAEMWFYKVGISILPPILAAPVAYVLFGFWFAIYEIWRGNEYEPWWFQIMIILAFVIFGNGLLVAGYFIAAVVFGLLAEIFCFTIVAGFVFIFLTADRWDYQTKTVSKVVKEMLDFISDASYTKNDRIIRILCLNYGYYEARYKSEQIRKQQQLYTFITLSREREELHKVTYADIRKAGGHSNVANIFSTGCSEYWGICGDFQDEVTSEFSCSSFKAFGESVFFLLLGIAGMIFVFVCFPLYVFSRIFTILYPYFLVWYIYEYDLFWKLDLFELTMLGVYIFLQLVIFIFFFFVFRTHLWLWHILPGQMSHKMKWNNIKLNEFLGATYKCYDDIQWLPFAQEIVLERFGKDIGSIVVEYLKAMQQIKM